MSQVNPAQKDRVKGSPIMAQWLTNLTGNHEVVGSIPDLTQWVSGLIQWDQALP